MLLAALGGASASAQGLAPADSQTLPNKGLDNQGSSVPGPAPSTSPPGTGPAPGEPGFTDGLFSPSRPNLLGGLYGIRPWLARYGVSVGAQETTQVFGNLTGGLHRGAAYEGLTTVSLGIDTGVWLGIPGGVFNISALQIHGRYLTADNLDVLQTATAVGASRSTRLWEVWYQQTLLGGKLDVKLGQLSLDQEFTISQYSNLFINGTAGFPVVPSVDLYGGGPAYPLSALGVRVRAQPVDNVTILFAAVDDNPPGGSFLDNGQVLGAEQSGTKFNTGTGAQYWGEIQYALNPAPAAGAKDAKPSGLPGVYKLGGYYDSGTFLDQRFGTDGLPLASPRSNGNPVPRRGAYSLYGILDQTLWQEGNDGPRSLGIFARLQGTPGDRNQVSIGFNAGLVVKAPIRGRDNDQFGVNFGLAKISSRAIQRAEDANRLGGHIPVPGTETTVELTYQYQAAPWLQLQPDVQYFYNPGGGIANPSNPTRRISNEAVLGLWSNVAF